MKIKICCLGIACILVSLHAFPASPTDSLRIPRWHLDVGLGFKGMQYTGPLWNYYHGIEKQDPGGAQYSRIPLPSPSIDGRLRLNLARHWFISQGLSVGAWVPYTKCRQGRIDFVGDMEGDEYEVMLNASASFGGGVQTGRHHFSALVTPHVFLWGRQRVRSSLLIDFRTSEAIWVNADISTDDTDYWRTADPFAAIFTKFGRNRLVWSASLRYDRDMQLFGKRAMIWGSLEMGLTKVYREFDVLTSIYSFSMPGMSSGFRAWNLGCMFALF